MNEIKVQFFKPLAMLFFVTSIPIFIFMVLISAWMIWELLMNPLPSGLTTVHLIGGSIIFPVMVVFCTKSTWFIFRYGRETLFTIFRLTERGINIENRRYGNLELEWGDIDTAIYDKPLKVVILNSRKLVSPIAISNNAQYQSSEFKEAVDLIKQKCTNRWKEKWL